MCPSPCITSAGTCPLSHDACEADFHHLGQWSPSGLFLVKAAFPLSNEQIKQGVPLGDLVNILFPKGLFKESIDILVWINTGFVVGKKRERERHNSVIIFTFSISHSLKKKVVSSSPQSQPLRGFDRSLTGFEHDLVFSTRCSELILYFPCSRLWMFAHYHQYLFL